MTRFFKLKILVPIVALVVLTSATVKSDYFEIAKQIEIFTTLFKELNMNYVDETNPADLMDTAIKSMLNDLDPYTQFYNEQDVEAARIKRTGDYTGIGAQISTLKDKLIVIQPYKNYPADRAGLKPGDEIISVDGTKVSDFKDNAIDLIKGAPDSKLKLTYVRQGKTYETVVTRSEIEIDAVPYFSMLNKDTGYIVLKKFNSKASKQTAYAIKDLKAQGATKLVLDLRGNPGGLLSEAVNIVNLFVPKGQLVVTTKSKIKKYNKTYKTKKAPLDLDIPLTVIINGRSASASEIVSGTLQDLDRAVIIGSRSFGKGLVQRPKKLTYGTQLKVTISRYYTPSGRCIQSLDYWNRDKEGNAVRVGKEDYKVFKTKNGRKVLDGGGVLPDEIVNSSKNSEITKALLNSRQIFNFATDFYYKNPDLKNINEFTFNDSHFEAFKNYLKTTEFDFETKTEKAIKKVLEVSKKEHLDDDLQTEYTALLNKLQLAENTAINENKAQITELLTEEIVTRYVYREGLFEYYKIHDKAINKSIEILNNPKNYSSYLK